MPGQKGPTWPLHQFEEAFKRAGDGVGFHVEVSTETANGQAVDVDRMDNAGGRLAAFSPAISFHEDTPDVTVTLYVEGDQVAETVAIAVEAAHTAFSAEGNLSRFGRSDWAPVVGPP